MGEQGLVKYDGDNGTAHFLGRDVRWRLVAGEPWLHASDACEAIGFANSRDAIARHVDPDDVVKYDTIDSMGRKQEANFINETGINCLLFRSNLPEARKYTRQVAQLMAALRQGKASIAQVDAPVLSPMRLRAEAMLINANVRAEQARIKKSDAYRQRVYAVHALSPLGNDVLASVEAEAAEMIVGAPRPMLKPAIAEHWFTVTEIAERFGVTPARVGLTITALAIRGIIDGIAKEVIGKSKHTDKNVTQYLYTEKAIGMIREKLIADGYLRDDGTPALEVVS